MESQAQNFKGSVMLGGSFSQIGGDDMGGFNKIGLMGGIQVAYPFSDVIDGSMGLVFVQKGSERTYDENGVGTGFWHSLSLGYIEVPLKVHYKVSDRFKVHGGLGVALLIASTFEPDQNSGEVEEDFVNTLDWTVHAGVSYSVSDNLFLFADYANSVVSIIENSPTSILAPRASGYFNVQLSVGAALHFN